MGFPIRTSPDYRLLASPRGFSQLATSFIAYLRQGIHTHALSSLTIKFTLRTRFSCLPPRGFRFVVRSLNILFFIRLWRPLQTKANLSAGLALPPHSCDIFAVEIATCSCPSITIQLSKNSFAFRKSETHIQPLGRTTGSNLRLVRDGCLLYFVVGGPG